MTQFGLCAMNLDSELLRLTDLPRKKFGRAELMLHSSQRDMK
jgi:hypothetical protein